MENVTTLEEKKAEVQDVESSETVCETVEEKPYKFRKLGAPDLFLMTKIISKIGINEFVACLEGDSIKNLVKAFSAASKSKEDGKEEAEAADSLYFMGAVAGTLEIANVILRNLDKCENEIYKLLSQTSNISEEEIKAEGNAVMFLEMVVDFLKKEEFPDFIKVVSKFVK